MTGVDGPDSDYPSICVTGQQSFAATSANTALPNEYEAVLGLD